jgi:hypothetical protein
VHYVREGLTARQHDELQAKIYKLMKTKHSVLLPQHQHFLTIDFVELGRGPTLACQVWVANMEMTTSVFKVARGNFCMQEFLCMLQTPLETPVSQPLPPIQNETASPMNVSWQIKLHPTLFTASYHGRTVRLPRSRFSVHKTLQSQPLIILFSPPFTLAHLPMTQTNTNEQDSLSIFPTVLPHSCSTTL